MLSAVLPSESLLSNGNNNPLFAFSGGFTPWENLESFFTSNDHKDNDQSKPKLGCYHADFGLGSESPNLTRYHVNFDLGLESQNKMSPCFDESNLSRYHAFSESPNQKSPCFDETNLDRYHVGSDLGLDSPNQKSPCFGEISPDDNRLDKNSLLTLSSSSSGSDDPSPNRNGSSSKTCIDERKRKRMKSNRESAKRSRMRKQRHLENLRNNANELKIQTRERSNHLRLINQQIQFISIENDRLKTESIILQRKLLQLGQIWQYQQLQRQCSNHHPSLQSASSIAAMQIIN
ncbi:hypothetical protein BVRB_6g128410 [Beta vulgaris subsp. vulgaris]|uniref:light-inducible protein CPRF2 n=1 Tax=Beta vulgaris subsp. vulgaris TaxID=3555 RepID=UPI00053F4FA5|nr:light-inducible protein CPRF2 [Beta vulgaris subsp. vulgaris]KMT09867.1 hypothetical protein BVRB_6g128410 [Beta vulgaris subsp. vulgaris]